MVVKEGRRKLKVERRGVSVLTYSSEKKERGWERDWGREPSLH